MIVLSNTTEQIVPVGQAITFDTIIFHTGNAEGHRVNSSSVKLRQCGDYDITFAGNVGSDPIGTVQLNIAFEGDILPETTMLSTAFASANRQNVSSTTALRNNCCAQGRITVVNTGTIPAIIGANPVLKVYRRA